MQAAHFSMAGEVLCQLAILTRMSSEVIEARNAFNEARQAFERAGQPDEAEKAAQRARELDQLLQNASQQI